MAGGDKDELDDEFDVKEDENSPLQVLSGCPTFLSPRQNVQTLTLNELSISLPSQNS